MAELYSEIFPQALLVLTLQRFLRWRKRSASGIKDKIQVQSRSRPSIARLVEQSKRRDTALEHAAAALFIDVFGRVTRKACDDVDLLLTKKVEKVFLPGLEKNREIASIDDPLPEAPALRHQHSEIRIQFGRAARNINRVHLGCVAQQRDHPLRRLARHTLGPLRPCIHMAVMTGLITNLAHIHLQRLDARAPQAAKAVQAQRGCEAHLLRRCFHAFTASGSVSPN